MSTTDLYSYWTRFLCLLGWWAIPVPSSHVLLWILLSCCFIVSKRWSTSNDLSCWCDWEWNEQQFECTSQCNYGLKWEKSVIAKECQTYHIISKWFCNPHNSSMLISQEIARLSDCINEQNTAQHTLTEANLYATINTQIGTKPHISNSCVHRRGSVLITSSSLHSI